MENYWAMNFHTTKSLTDQENAETYITILKHLEKILTFIWKRTANYLQKT